MKFLFQLFQSVVCLELLIGYLWSYRIPCPTHCSFFLFSNLKSMENVNRWNASSMGNFPALALSFSHTAHSQCASVSFSGFCFLSHFRRQRPADSLMAASGAKMKNKKKRKTREGIKKNGIWKTHSVITWFTRHLRLSLLLFASSVFLFRFITFFIFFLSDFAICQWNCLSTRCELKIWWWFNKTQFAPPRNAKWEKRGKLNSSDGLCN